MSFFAIIVAAGSGLRAGAGEPKAWRTLGGKPLLRWSVEAMAAAGAEQIVVVVARDRLGDLAQALAGLSTWRGVAGGATRGGSVRAGLESLGAGDSDIVLIHDAARPFLQAAHVERLLEAMDRAQGAVPALPISDTLKRGQDVVAGAVSRDGLWRVQTPQAFRFARIKAAYDALPLGEEITDDAGVVERAGGTIALAPGDPMLMKLTYPEDFAMAERLAQAARVVRVGQGLDAHRWGPGEAVWLCGVSIDHDRSLVGHSDADAGVHSVTDAILGAIGEGDIGDHFPPSDPRWKGASSDRFLTHAVGLVAARGGRILNVDVTLVCEKPRIGPHRQAMRERLAALLALPVDRVSVKATTTEGMGFTGREEGLVAQAVVAVETPA